MDMLEKVRQLAWIGDACDIALPTNPRILEESMKRS